MSDLLDIYEIPKFCGDVIISLGGVEQIGKEISVDYSSKRWFRGRISGAYVIDEVDGWRPITKGSKGDE